MSRGTLPERANLNCGTMKTILSSFVSSGLKSVSIHGRVDSLSVTADSLDVVSLADLGSSLLTSVNAWSVAGPDLNSADVASSFFAASLFPYLAFLFFLSRSPTKTPPAANFGFQFLLAFVFATIPAGIIAKVQYGDTLANVDFLHGPAESLLTVTNLLIIFGFRTMRGAPRQKIEKKEGGLDPTSLNYINYLIPAAVAIFALGSPTHAEPSNALSLPTWVVHTSSVIDWIVAMSLVWRHAEVSGNPRWKGLSMGMVPSHASGLCACTYHIFYNSPYLGSLVALQAALTCVGNATMGFAAYRIFAYERERQKEERGTKYTSKGLYEVKSVILDRYDDRRPEEAEKDGVNGDLALGWKDTVFNVHDSQARAMQRQQIVVADVPTASDDLTFGLDLAAKALLGALFVKYGELYLDFPFTAMRTEGQSAGIIPYVMIFGPALACALFFTEKNESDEGGVPSPEVA